MTSVLLLLLSTLIIAICKFCNASAPYFINDIRRMLTNGTDVIVDEMIKGPLQYDQDLTLHLLRYAYATYDDAVSELESWSCGLCCDNTNKLLDIQLTESEQLLALTGYDESIDAIIIAFRGSDNLCNWLCVDFDPYPTDYTLPIDPATEIGRVAAGFYEGWRNDLKANVVSNITSLIDEYISNTTDCRIYLTGHSLVTHKIVCNDRFAPRININATINS